MALTVRGDGTENAHLPKHEYVNSDTGLYFRDNPSLNGNIVDLLPFAKKVRVLKRGCGDDGNWKKVKVDGAKGYVFGEYLQEENPFDEMDYLGKWIVTAYSHTGSACANGNMPSEGYTIACNSLPFGTEIYISEVGFRTVEDRGPDWMGNEWCDLYITNYHDCVIWGAQSKDIWIVKEN